MPDSSQSFGKYEILRQVGRGGFATVYLARDNTLKREVALKLLHPHYALEPEMAQRFLEEAQTAANLSHPNIITVFEVGDLDGQLFLAMEYVEGGALQERLEKAGPLSLSETADTLIGIADALDYAHSRGLIHRDIKPANILLKTPRQNRPWPVLTDFGLVKALSHSTSLTRSGAILGTVEYMAPEQIDSDRRQEVGPASDIYALGIVAYHMLTGQTPFSGSTVQVINGHLNKQPPAPAEVRADLPASVSLAILRAIAKQPADRYPSATAFVQELKSASEPAPVAAPPPIIPTPPPPPPPQRTPPPPVTPPTQQPKSQPEPAPRPNRLLPLLGAGALVIVALIVLIFLLRGRGNGLNLPQPTPTLAATVALAPPTAIPTVTANAALVATATVVATTVGVATTALPLPSPTPTVYAAFTGSIVFTRNTSGGSRDDNEIYRYDFASGQTTRLTDNHFDDHIPRWAPDGSQIAFTSNRSGVAGAYDIWTMNPDGSNQQVYLSTGAWDEYAAWEPTGHKVIVRGPGRKLARPYAGQQAVAVTMAFVTTGLTQGVANAEIFVGGPGATVQQTANEGRDEWPSWSPDGSSLVYGSEHNGDMDIYRLTVGLPLSQPQALYISDADENQPAWSPDGDRIVFVSREHADDAYGHLMLGTADGRSPLLLPVAFARDPAWAPDGRWIVFSRGVDSDGDGKLTDADESDLWAVRIGDGLLAPIVEGPGSDGSPSWYGGDVHAGQIAPTPAQATPTAVVPTPTPTGDWAQITGISIQNRRYVVDFITSGYQPRLGGSNRHVHFFFDTVAPEDAGMPGNGPWQIYPTDRGVVGTSPFTLYRVSDRPANAHQICILVANSDHSVRQGTGNCVDLP